MYVCYVMYVWYSMYGCLDGWMDGSWYVYGWMYVQSEYLTGRASWTSRINRKATQFKVYFRNMRSY